MAIDPRREASHIRREFVRYHNTVGEAVLWYVFDKSNSQYDSVYDEGYRRYELARRVPVLWTDQQEMGEDYSPEGRRPTQRLRFAVGAMQLFEQGISITESHGDRISDMQVSPVWKDDRLNDIVFYDGRFYEISNFQIRGRLQNEDVVIGVSCIETKPSDEMNLDNLPEAWFPVPPLNPSTPTSPDVSFGSTAPDNPQVGDIWLDTQ